MTSNIFNIDARDFLVYTKDRYRMLFADPPDNTNLGYSGFKDSMSDRSYKGLITEILYRGHLKADVIWLSFNPVHTPLVGSITYEFIRKTGWEFRPCVQTFTFGQHNHRDLGFCHRPLYRYMREGSELYPDEIRVPSWRQLNGDKRADPRGRVPGTVFDFPRVTGNSKQRRRYCPTQLHEGLYERCIKLCCKPGDTVVDLFAGSGTLGRVAPRIGVNGIMVEISRETCDNILADQPWTEESKWLIGER